METHILAVNEVLSAPVTGIHARGVCAVKVTEGEAVERRRRALRRLDRELEKGNCKAALSLVKQFKTHPAGLLRGFGAITASKVHRSVSSSELAGRREISSLRLVIDAILHSIRHSLEFQLQEEEIEHEAGHFLVGYMLGVLPRRYKVPSVEDLSHDKFAQGKVEFFGFEFLREVGVGPLSDKNFSKGKLNEETLTKFSCVTLGGLAAEHLLFGYSELLHSDVLKLDRIYKWLGLTEDEVDFEHRLAAEFTAVILSSQSEALSELSEAMALGRSVGFCIDTIEHTLNLNNKL